MAGIDKHIWAPHKAQRKQETMYHLRRLIRDSGVGVEYGLRSVTCALGENLEPLMDEVLQSKCPEDGQNLLMYAASEGNEAWFLRLVGDIRSRLGVCALVKELREIDIDGAPILFHAASCRREHSCFRTAYDLIYTVLGKGGLMEQVEAVDGLGRGILMHAARSAHVETFKEVFDVCEKKAALMIPSSKVHDITAADIDELSKFIRDSGPQDFCEYCRDLASNLDRADELQKVFEDNYREDKPRQLLEGTDHVGMNCLHHAAEAGCCDVLKEVIEKCQNVETAYGDFVERLCQAGCLRGFVGQKPFFSKMNAADESASKRTPIMYVLRNMSSGLECTNGQHQFLRDKFDALYRELRYRPIGSSGEDRRIGWMAPQHIPPPPSAIRDDVPTRTARARAVTELLHAARGGLASLELALNKLEPFTDDGSVRTVDLDEVLHVEISTKQDEAWTSWTPNGEAKTWGRALLLAAAAKRGDQDALYHVLLAIETGVFKLVKKDGAASFILAEEGNDAATSSSGGEKTKEEVKRSEERKSTDGESQQESTTAGADAMGSAGAAEIPSGRSVKEVVEKIDAARVSLFSYAIISGQTKAVEFVFDLVVKLFGKKHDTTWRILSGHDNKSGSSSLTCAASTSMESDCNGRTMFDKVYTLLKKVSTEKQLREELSGQRPDPRGTPKISPLVGAAFSSNWVLFRQVYDSFETLSGNYWWRCMVMRQIPPSVPSRQRSVVNLKELHACHDDNPSLITRGAWSIPAVMWSDIVEAFKRAQPDNPSSTGEMASVSGETSFPSWREDFKAYSRRAVKVAAERGTFTALRDLVKEGFPLHDDHIPALLESIGDHEQDIIEIILYAVANASNPFVMGAMVSRTLRRSEVDHPMHHKGLRRLQGIVDSFTNELLEKLPHTVRGMGVALLGGHQPIFYGHGLQQGKRHRLGNLAGFIVVQWMLEPCILFGDINKKKMHDGPEVVDPLRRALDRGSQGLDFLNSPLVLDYVHVKFTGTLPKWTSRNPFQPTVNEGFYKYDDFDKYDLRDVLLAPAKPVAVANTANDEDGQDDKNVETAVEKAAREAAEKEGFLSMAFLLRFLQGWDHGCKAVRNIPSLWFPAKSAASIAGRPNSCQLMIPHLTMLPGLQFSLAGILGKPGTFYKVPVMRFVFEIFSYLVMLVLFCSSVLLKQHDVVPPDEAIFYVYAAGMLWREVLEFRDGLPARRHPASKHQDGTPPKVLSEPRLSDIGAGSRFNRMVSAFTRYVFFDTWNFLDTSTIVCILVAFIFRMLALNDDFFLFHAQFFLALSAPLLFWRLLVLSQIDSTLGPMTQVIWRMMSHTLRFSAFIAMVMLSFALAFQAVFHTCDPKANDSIPQGFEYCALHDAFGSFGDSFVTVFSSALGGSDFDLFDDLGDGCRCDLPSGARIAGISLMVVYMITMSVVLLNLLIAVLSTAHDEVYANAEKEFHLARARLIYQSARVVTRRRPPPPLNLIKVVLGLLVDTGTELWRGCLWIQGWTASRRNNEAATDAGEQYRKRAKKLEPFSTTSRWKNCDDHIQELEFALTLGGTAVGLSTVLWVLSVPWVAWCMLRSVRPPEDVRHRASSSTEKPANGSRPAGCQDDNNHHNNNGGKNTGAPGSSRWNCCLRRKKRDGGSTPPGGQDDSNTGNNIDDRANQHLGYFLRIMSAAKSLVGLVLATICAVGLCILYIAGSFILWVLGWGMLVRKLVAELWEWEDSQTEYGVAPPDAMPGQEGGDHWERAWELARRRNQGVREDYGPARFHFGPFYVVPFLKSLTGLESQHLARLTKERDERSMFEQELIEVDRTLAGAHIDLEHLGAKAKSRSKKAYQNRLTRVFGGSSDRDFRGSAAPTPASAPAPALASPAPAVVSPAAAIESTDPAVASPAPAVESPAPGVTAATTEAGDHGSGDPLLTGGGPQPGGEGHLPSEDAARPGAHTPVTNDDSTPASAPAPAVASPAPAGASPAPAVASPAPAVASPAPGVTAATTEAGDHGSGDPLLTGGGPQPGGEGHLPSEDAARPEAHTPVTNDDSTPASAPAPAVANPAPAVASPAPAVASPAPAVESPAPGVTAATTEAGDHGSDDPLLTRGVPQPEGEGHLPSEDAARPGAHTPVTNDDSKPIYRAGVVGSDGLGGTASIEDDIIDKLARELLDLLKKRKGEKQSRADDTTGES